MKNSKQLLNDFIAHITLRESADEISGIAFMVFESVFGIDRTDILSEKLIETSPHFEMRLREIAERINNEEPIQYILGTAFFFGREFRVNSSVLIPRPETEELVSIALERLSFRRHPKVIDLGTGSGCIAITIAVEFPSANVWASDISKDALQTASQNARALGASVEFIHHDILSSDIPDKNFDLIISNPPYVSQREKKTMQKNVIDYEPHLALFVPDNDPLIFYRAIAMKAKSALRPGGELLVEVNERFGKEVQSIFDDYGIADAQVIKDLQGKDRIVLGSFAG